MISTQLPRFLDSSDLRVATIILSALKTGGLEFGMYYFLNNDDTNDTSNNQNCTTRYLEHKVIVEVSFVLSVLRAGLEGGRLRRGRHALESEINQKCYEDVNKKAR